MNSKIKVVSVNPNGFSFNAAPEYWLREMYMGCIFLLLLILVAEIFTSSPFFSRLSDTQYALLRVSTISLTFTLLIFITIWTPKFLMSDRNWDRLLEREALLDWWHKNPAHPRFFISGGEKNKDEILVTVFRGSDTKLLEKGSRFMLGSFADEEDIQRILLTAKI